MKMKSLVVVSLFALSTVSCGREAQNPHSGVNAAPKAFKVDEKAVEAALRVLEKTAQAGSTETASFTAYPVTGSTVKEMLKSYAEVSKKHDMLEVKIYTRMDASMIPSADDAQDIVGLAKNVDVAGFAVDLYTLESDSQIKILRKTSLAELFKITKAGAFVGVESHSWNVCGTQIPGLIVLDPVAKKVFSLTPDNTEC